MAVNGGTLPCVRLARATSGNGVTKEPHLSPQHYELNAIQHVLDRTRVSVCGRYSTAMQPTSLGEVAVQTSPQHYELNAIQHVLDRTRVSVCGRYSTAMQPTSLGEVAVQTSPQHYELNAIQHVLDRTRVSVCGRYSTAMQPTSLGEVAVQTSPPRSVPSLFDGIAQNKAQTSIVSKGREGGKNFTRILY